MFDPACMFMGICYLWGCLQWGNWKADEYKYNTESPNRWKEYTLLLVHTTVAPITATIDLFKRSA